MKICARCKVEKDESEFGKSKQQKSGLFPYCYQCCREKGTEHRRKKGIKPLRKQTIDELAEHKICTRCKIDKSRDEFRLRHETKSGTSYYINPTCRKCDGEIAHTYYESKKNDENFKKKNRERAKNYQFKNADKVRATKQTIEFRNRHAMNNKNSYYRMSDVIKAKMKVKRQTSEYKANMKAYREKNKEKIEQQEAITKRRYQVKNMEGLTDKYVAQMLGIKVSEIAGIKEQFPEIFEIKRAQLFLDREMRKLHKK